MKWALACALALAAANTAAALTLPAGTHTSAGNAVTVSLVSPAPAVNDTARFRPHPATAAPATSWTVKPGQSLSFIAGKAYGSTSLWPALWWVNKAAIRDPDLITSGQVIKLSRWHPGTAWLDRAALRAIPAPPAAHAAPAAVTARHGHHAASGKIWGVTRGYPNLCGDGDGDGWDVNCQARTAPVYHYRHASARVSSRAATASTGGYSVRVSASSGPGGSFGACVVARESGGNSQVMNSSGHYGLYQFSASTWVAYGGSAASFGHASVAEQERVFSSALAQGGQSNWSPYDGC